MQEDYVKLMEERERDLSEWRAWVSQTARKVRGSKNVYQTVDGSPKVKTKLMETEQESRKEKKIMSEPYYIGTILPEAKRAWFTLQELMEGRSRERNTEAQEKGIGSILPQAKTALKELRNCG